MNEQKPPDPDALIGSNEALAVLKNDTMNLLKKVNDGKPLTKEERERFAELLDRRLQEEAQKVQPLAEQATRSVTHRMSKLERDHLKNLRRLKVFELRCAGKTISAIAAATGSTRETIAKDVRWLEEQFAETLNVREATRLIRERLLELRIAKMIAMREVEGSRGVNRSCFLATYLNIIDREIRLMQDVGLIPKKAIALEHSGPEGGPISLAAEAAPQVRLEDLTDEELAAIERAAERIAGQRAAERRN